MVNNTDSQCYFVQLQIDSFLDGDLNEAQRGSFMAHVQQCQECAREFHFAQTVHDAVLDMPNIDCDESVLEPIHRLTDGAERARPAMTRSLWERLADRVFATPVLARYAAAAAVITVIAVAVSPALLNQQQPAPLLAEQPPATATEAYSPEDIQQALQDLSLAIDYLNEVSQRTEVMIGDRFLITPLQDSLNASFERARGRRQDSLRDDPI